MAGFFLCAIARYEVKQSQAQFIRTVYGIASLRSQ